MSRPRFIDYDGKRWRFGALADANHLARGTLHKRLERFGETPTGIARALATGIMDRSQSGRAGACKSPWRYRKNPF